MKRYDEIVRAVNKQTNLMQVMRGWTADEMSYYLNHQDKYDIYVECRSCGNKHKMNQPCQVCDLTTKVKPEMKVVIK